MNFSIRSCCSGWRGRDPDPHSPCSRSAVRARCVLLLEFLTEVHQSGSAGWKLLRWLLLRARIARDRGARDRMARAPAVKGARAAASTALSHWWT